MPCNMPTATWGAVAAANDVQACHGPEVHMSMQEAVVVAYHAMMARLHLTFAKQQALLSNMATPAAPNAEAQREPMVVRIPYQRTSTPTYCSHCVNGCHSIVYAGRPTKSLCIMKTLISCPLSVFKKACVT